LRHDFGTPTNYLLTLLFRCACSGFMMSSGDSFGNNCCSMTTNKHAGVEKIPSAIGTRGHRPRRLAMLNDIITADQLSLVISQAAAPAFLLGAIASFLSVLSRT